MRRPWKRVISQIQRLAFFNLSQRKTLFFFFSFVFTEKEVIEGTTMEMARPKCAVKCFFSPSSLTKVRVINEMLVSNDDASPVRAASTPRSRYHRLLLS